MAASDDVLVQFFLAVSAEGMKSGFKSGANLMEKFSKDTKTHLGSVQKSFKDTGDSIENFTQRFNRYMQTSEKALRSYAAETGTQTGAVKKAFDNMASSIEARLNKMNQGLTDSVAKASKFKNDIISEFSATTVSLGQGSLSLKDYKDNLDKLTSSARSTASALAKVQANAGLSGASPPSGGSGTTASSGTGGSGGSGGSGIGLASQAAGGSGNAFPSGTPDVSKITESLTAYADQLQKTENASRQAASIIITSLFAIAAAASQPIKAYGDFEATLYRFQSVTEATNGQLDQLAEMSHKLGTSTQFSAQAVALASVEIGKLGYDTQQTLAILPGVVSAAAAGQLELAKASEIVGTSMKGFNLAANQSVHVSDLFAKAAATSAIDFNDLGETMKYVSGIAYASNQPIEDMTALIAIMGNNMIKGSQAGTSLRHALLNLERPTRAGREVLQALNIEIGDKMTGNVRPLVDVLKDLQAGLKDVDQVTRNAAIAALFGQEALSGMAAILNQSPEDIDRYVAAMHNVDGAAKEMADVSFRGLNAELKKLDAAFESAKIAMGESFAGQLQPVIDKTKEMLKTFEDMPVGIKDMTAATVILVAEIGLMALGIAGGTFALAGIQRGLLAVIGVERIATAVTIANTAATEAAYVKNVIFNGALASGASKWGALRAAGTATAVSMQNTMMPALLGTITQIVKLTGVLGALYLAWMRIKMALDEVKNDEMAQNEQAATIEVQQKKAGALADAIRRIHDPKNAGKTLQQLFTPQEMQNVAANIRDAANQIKDPKTKESLFAQAEGWSQQAQSIKAAGEEIKKITKLESNFKDSIYAVSAAETEEEKKRALVRYENAKKALARELELSKKNANARISEIESVERNATQLDAKLEDIVKRGRDSGGGRSPELKALDSQLQILTSKISSDKSKFDATKAMDALSAGGKTEMLQDLLAKTAEKFYMSGNADKWALEDPIKIKVNGALKGLVDLGVACAATVTHILKLSGATEDLTKVLKNSNVAPDVIRDLRDAGFIKEVKREEAKPGALALGNHDQHIGMLTRGNGVRGIIVNASNSEGAAWANQGARTKAGGAPNQRIMPQDIRDSAFAGADAKFYNWTDQGLKMGFRNLTPPPDRKAFEMDQKNIKDDIVNLQKLKAQYDALGDTVKSAEVEKMISDAQESLVEGQKKFNDQLNKNAEQMQANFQDGLKKAAKEMEDNAKALTQQLKSIATEIKNINQTITDQVATEAATELEKAQYNANKVIAKVEKSIADAKAKLASAVISDEDRKKARATIKKMESDLKHIIEQEAAHVSRVELDEKNAKQSVRDAIKKSRAIVMQAMREENTNQTISKIRDDIANPKTITDENGNPISVEVTSQKALLPLLAKRKSQLQDILDKMHMLDPQELASVENQKKLVDLRQKILDIEIEEGFIKDKNTRKIDKQIKAEAELALMKEKVAKNISDASAVSSKIGEVIGMFSGNNDVAKQTGTIFSAIGQSAGSLAKGLKELKSDGSNWLEVAASTGTDILQQIASVSSMFPDEETIRREAASFKSSIMKADLEIMKARLESQKEFGGISIDQFYDGMVEAEKKNLDIVTQDIAEELRQKLAGMMNVFDYFSLITSGKPTATTQKRMQEAIDLAYTQYDQALNVKVQAEKKANQQRDQEKLDRNTKILNTDMQTRVSHSKRLGDTLEQIEADHQAKMAEIQGKKDEAALKYQYDLDAKAYVSTQLSLNEEIATADEDAAKSKRDYYQNMRAMAFDHEEAQIMLKKTGYEQQAALDELSVRKELDANADRIKELEDKNLTWTDEYKALKQKETDIHEAANKKKLESDIEYARQVQEIRNELSAALADLTASEIDDFAATRDKQLADLDKWKDDMLKSAPKEADAIIATYVAKSAKIYRTFDENVSQSDLKRHQASREMLQLEANATSDMLDDIQQEYANTIADINEQEKMALNSFLLDEKQKAEAVRKSAASRLIAEKKYYEDIKKMTVAQLNDAKKVRDMMFEMDTKDRQAKIDGYEHDIKALDLQIRSRQLAIDRIKAAYDLQRKAIQNEDLTKFEAGQAAINADEQVRKALKFNQVNITGNPNSAAARVTQSDALDAYVAHLQQKANDDRILRVIDDSELTRRLQEATLIKAKFANEQINIINDQYNTEIAAAEAANQNQEQIDLLRGKRDKELEDMRKKYADAFTEYKDLEAKAIDANQELDTKATQTEIDNLTEKKLAAQQSMEDEQIALDKLRLVYETDIAKIDKAIKSVEDSHNDLAITVDQMRISVNGTIDSILARYEKLQAAADAFKNTLANTAMSSGSGGSSSGGSSSPSKPSSDLTVLPPGTNPRKADTGQSAADMASSGYYVNADGYWYKTSTDMMNYKSVGLKEGALMPDIPHLRGKDPFGPYMLDAGERVLSRKDNLGLMDTISMLPGIFQRGLAMIGSGASSVSLVMYNTVRNNNDIDLIVNKVTDVMDQKKISSVNVYGHLAR